MEEANKNIKVKSIIDFESQNTSSIKSMAMAYVFKGFSQNYIYDIIDVFCFPNEEIRDIYAQNYIIKCFIYLILTDTDSCSIKFLFVSDIKSNITESDTHSPIFKIITQSKIRPRLASSDAFFKQCDCHRPKLKKQVGPYEIESIDNPNVITIAVNPKEYSEAFRNINFNKKHKGVKKTTSGMDFESYASRILDLREYDSVDRAPKKT